MDVLSGALTASLREAHLRSLRRGSRLSAHVEGRVYRVLRIWDGGFQIDGGEVEVLRGLVDLYDGPRFLRHCLIVASYGEDGLLTCEFKSSTLGDVAPPADFVRDADAPVGYLPGW